MKIIHLLILSFFILTAKAQPYFEMSLNSGGSVIETDYQGRLYILNKNQVSVYNPNSNLQIVFSGRNSSVFTAIDNYSPFKLIVFDKSFREFILLDYNLNLIQNEKIKLPVEIYGDIFFCRTNNNFFILDAEQNKLFKYSKYYEFERVFELTKLRGKKITGMRYEANKLYFSTSGNKLFVYDSEPAYIEMINIPANKNFKISNSQLSFLSDNSLNIILFSLVNRNTETLKIPETINAEEVMFNNGLTYILSKQILLQQQKTNNSE